VRLVAAVLVVVAASASGAVAPLGATSAATAEPALRRYLARPDEPLTEYRARRHLEAWNERFDLTASLDAVTELQPSGRFSYTVVHESGSDYVRKRVLHGVLDNEVELSNAGNLSRFTMSATNYELAAGELTDDGTVRLSVKPRRKDVGLIDGAVFVTAADADLVRVEGRFVKTPSFWTTRVDVVRHYTRIAGVRVPIRLETTAHLRLAGVSTMLMTYDYEIVNGQVVSAP